MFQISSLITKIRILSDEFDSREYYVRHNLQPIVRVLLRVTEHAENLPANFLEHEFRFCQWLLLKDQTYDFFYEFKKPELGELYVDLLLWRMRRGVDCLEDYQVPISLKDVLGMTRLIEKMVELGRSVADERFVLLIGMAADDCEQLSSSMKSRCLIAFARSDMVERDFIPFVAAYLPGMSALDIHAVFVGLLNARRFETAAGFLESVFVQAGEEGSQMADLARYMCCKTFDNYSDKDQLVLSDEFEARLSTYIARHCQSASTYGAADWVQKKLAAIADFDAMKPALNAVAGQDTTQNSQTYMYQCECAAQRAKFELANVFEKRFEPSATQDEFITFVSSCADRRVIAIPANELASLLLPYAHTVERKVAFVKLLLRSVFIESERHMKCGFTRDQSGKVTDEWKKKFTDILYPSLKQCFENAGPDECGRIAEEVTIAFVTYITDRVWKHQGPVNDSHVMAYFAYVDELLATVRILIPYQSLETAYRHCMPLCQFEEINQLTVSILADYRAEFFACLINPAGGSPHRYIEAEWIMFRLDELACWGCRDALFVGGGVDVAMPAWIMMDAQQLLPANREVCYQVYTDFVRRFARMNETMPANMRDQYAVELVNFLEEYHVHFAQLLQIMGEDTWRLLSRHYMSFSVVPIVRLFSLCRNLYPEVVDCLVRVYQKYRNEINAGQVIDLWEQVLVCAGSISLMRDIDFEKTAVLGECEILSFWQEAMYSALDKAHTLVEFVEHMECEMYRLLHAFLGVEVGKEQRDAYRSQAPDGAIFMMFKGVMSVYKSSFDDKYRAGLFRVLKSMLRMDFGMPAAIGEEVNLLTTEVETHNQALRARVTELGGDADLACAYPETMEFTYHRGEAVTVEVQLFEQYQVIWKYLIQLQQKIAEVLPEEVTPDDEFYKNLKSVYDHIQSLSGLIGADHSVEGDLSAAQVKKLEGQVGKLGRIVVNANHLKKRCQETLALHEHVGEFIDHTLAAKERLDELFSQMTEEHEQKLAEEEDAEEKKEQGKKRKKKLPSKYAGMKSFQIEFLRKDDPAFLYVGDEVSCCLAPDSFEFRGIVERRMDAGMTIPVVRDKATGKIVALAWLYLAEAKNSSEDGFYVVANFQEIATDYLNDPHARDAIISALLHYVGQFYVQDIRANGLMLARLDYGAIANHDHLKTIAIFTPEKLGGCVTFGERNARTYYLDSLNSRGCYKFEALEDIHYDDKVNALIAECGEESDLSEVVPQALQYVRDQVGHYYSAAPEQQGRLDSLLARAQSEAEQWVRSFLIERRKMATREAASARAVREVGVCTGGGVAVPAASSDILQKV